MAKTILVPFKVIDAGSMGGNLTGTWTDITKIDDPAFHMEWTGSPTGTFSVEVAGKPSPGASDGIPVTLSATVDTTTSPAGINLAGIGFPYVRLKYTRTSGSGTLTAWVSGKSI